MTLQRILGIILLILSTLSCSACSARGDDANRNFKKSKYSLAITGYNYTNNYIGSFSVNGTGGGNIFVSSPTSGGGGTVCCASYYPKIKNYTIHVKWQSGGCKYYAGMGTDGKDIWLVHPYFKETEAPVINTSPQEPEFMEVHFYPDNKVEAHVTPEYSRPLLKLEESREIRENFPRCPNDKEPK